MRLAAPLEEVAAYSWWWTPSVRPWTLVVMSYLAFIAGARILPYSIWVSQFTHFIGWACILTSTYIMSGWVRALTFFEHLFYATAIYKRYMTTESVVIAVICNELTTRVILPAIYSGWARIKHRFPGFHDARKLRIRSLH